MKNGLATLLVIAAVTGAMAEATHRKYKPTGRDAISEEDQAEKLSKAAEKRARKAAKRAGK